MMAGPVPRGDRRQGGEELRLCEPTRGEPGGTCGPPFFSGPFFSGPLFGRDSGPEKTGIEGRMW